MYVFKDDRDFVLKTRELLLKQGAKSLEPNTNVGCVYRSDGGYGCAIGIHLEDECYHKEMENALIDSIMDRSRNNLGHPQFDQLINNLRQKFFNVKLKTMKAVQSIHDTNEVEGWTAAFDGLLERLDDK